MKTALENEIIEIVGIGLKMIYEFLLNLLGRNTDFKILQGRKNSVMLICIKYLCWE